jgi:ubiquinol-cytochrome c reductase iron-sulfur subunit
MMSNEIEAIKDPGLPAHVHRKADHDPVAAKRAERQVAILFGISSLGTLLLIASFFIPDDIFIFVPVMGNQNAHQLGLGLGMAISLFFIGMGAIHWAKTLMPDQEVIAHRHEFRSPDSDRKEFVDAVKEGAQASGLGRRSLIKRSLGAALGLSALSPSWKAGTYLVTDPGNRRIKASDLEVGAVAQVLPETSDPEHRKLNDIAKDALLLIRLRPEEFNLDAERLSWTHEGIIAFSKICSHMGCAVALYEQQTKHLLCPCHQSTFDVTRAAKVIFGPAARPLPQLNITVDEEGYLIARTPFTEPVGPSFWGRNS